MKKLLFFTFILSLLTSYAQDKVTISGSINDAANGEELIGATVYVQELKTGVAANIYGFYSLEVPKGTYTFVYSFIGYANITETITLNENLKKNVEMSESSTEIQEIVITGEKLDENVTSTEMSVAKISTKEIEKIPVIFGEKDVLKTIALLPGVSSAGEGNAGFYVRGGGSDQNLILLDEAVVYNASHLLGFFSVFNSDAVKDIKLYKGGIPAQYGGRLSSVLDVKMKNGNDKKLSASGGIGMISSRLTVEGPIVKDKGSFVVSGRRMYLDQFFRFAKEGSAVSKTKINFYDLNAKANYRIGEKDRIFISAYTGRDGFGFKDSSVVDQNTGEKEVIELFGLYYGNLTTTLRWNHLFNDKLFMNTTGVMSKYNYRFGIGAAGFDLESSIRDFNLKNDFDYFYNANNTIKFGTNITHHTFEPGNFIVNSKGESNGLTDFKLGRNFAMESGAYVSNEQSVGARIKLNYGLRLSSFHQYGGPQDIYEFDNEGMPTDTTKFENLEHIQSYVGLEPRFGINFSLNESSSIKASYMRTRQYVHLLQNAGTGTPLDLWRPSSFIVKPEVADQIALGYFKNLKNNTYETSAEVYYKRLENLIDYRDFAQIILNPLVEGQLVFGDGFAYGLELFFKKKAGKFNGWIGYTLATSKRQFEDVNNGDIYPARQDRRHDISIVGIYDITEKLSVSASWVYNTGDAITLPVGKYSYQGSTYDVYGLRNQERYPSYHRMDLGITYYAKKTDKFESSWNLSVYNLYNQKNPFQIDFVNDEANANSRSITLTYFPIIPALTWNFKF